MHCFAVTAILILLALVHMQDSTADIRLLSHSNVHHVKKGGLLSNNHILTAGEVLKTCPKSTKCKKQGWYRVGQKCVKYFKISITFGEAEKFCQQQHRKGHLVMLHNEKEMNTVQCIIMKCNPKDPRVWLGATRQENGQYAWLDGSKLEYQPWVPGQPDFTMKEEKCLEMNWACK
ncbi:snaclec A8-like [Centroberyx affinis]|uniref:snaclec A8-like n=1 Tax=Centroberyx affinis TaxID=166261 RepID=UPI003A5C39D8